MSKLSDEPQIVTLASELGLNWRLDAVAEIVKNCLATIAAWINEHSPITTIAQLEQLVCMRLGLVFEEVHEDADVERIVRKYVALGEKGFAGLRNDFDESTFAALLRRNHAACDAPDRFVAVIDCRGPKAARRFFSKWHEIAHLLTTPNQFQFTFHRSTTERSPTERLMDQIAAEIGFYDPIFGPAFDREFAGASRLSFDLVQQIRESVCPDASFQATLIACVKRSPHPMLYIEAGMALKKAEKARLRSNQLDLIPLDPPSPELRASVVVPNDAAKSTGLLIHKNMRVPDESIIFSHFFATDGAGGVLDAEGAESLTIWKHSDGKSIGNSEVVIESRRIVDRIVAVVSAVSGKLNRLNRPAR